MGFNLELTSSADGDHAMDLYAHKGYFALCDWIATLPTGNDSSR